MDFNVSRSDFVRASLMASEGQKIDFAQQKRQVPSGLESRAGPLEHLDAVAGGVTGEPPTGPEDRRGRFPLAAARLLPVDHGRRVLAPHLGGTVRRGGA